MYNALHQHLKRFENDLLKSAQNSFINLRLAINATQKKLTKYYEMILDAQELYFNLVNCFNSCDKLNYYNANSTTLCRALCRATRHNALHNLILFLIFLIEADSIILKFELKLQKSRHL